MRIDPSSGGQIGGANGAGQTQNVNSTQSGQSAQSSVSGDQVDLSSASSLVALSAGMVSSTRQARIEGLAALVQNGQYHVDAGQLASSIVDNMLQA